jgi:hypothetical protein
MTTSECAECGARYSSAADSCANRFDQLLALDHSRREPWGSRHGQAFAAFVLQHPSRHPASLDVAWAALFRIYRLKEPASRVFAGLRAAAAGSNSAAGVPPRPSRMTTRAAVTIADLDDFAAATYATQLDEWCIATLRAYGADVPADATSEPSPPSNAR